MIVRDIDMARGRLPERADAKDHAVVFPALLVNAEHRRAGRRARQAGLETAHGLFAAEFVRDRNDERCGHRKYLTVIRLDVIPRGSKGRGYARYGGAIDGTFTIPICFSK